jgi:hypothetical protein
MRKSLFLLFVVLAASLFSVNVFAQDQFKRWPDDDRNSPPPAPRRLPPPPRKPDPQQVTLFSRITQGSQDYGRSAFSFYGVRSDDRNWRRVAGSAHLLYGSISIDHDTDWLEVSMAGDDASRVKDLGEMQWADVSDAPLLPANPRPNRGIRFPGRGESYESSSDGRVTRAVAGHMYVVHIKNSVEEFYAMFRVDSLVPSDHCTISWRVMRSPKR